MARLGHLFHRSRSSTEGRHVERDGKKQYAAILQWADRPTADRWSDAVVALVRERYPEAFDQVAA